MSRTIPPRAGAALIGLLLGYLSINGALAGESAPGDTPGSADALAAWHEFVADPPARLERTGPFLDYIRRGGEVHIVLNEDLLGFMYDEGLDPTRKAVLYAAFLGANMAAQLERGEAGNDDLAAMQGTLAAYRALQDLDDALEVPALEPFAAAARAGTLPHAVQTAAGGAPID